MRIQVNMHIICGYCTTSVYVWNGDTIIGCGYNDNRNPRKAFKRAFGIARANAKRTWD